MSQEFARDWAPQGSAKPRHSHCLLHHRFGTALSFSLVEDAATVGVQAVGNQGANTTRVPSDAASTILQQNAEIKPVLRKNQGEDVGITVAQDFDFSSVYGLSLK